MRDEPLASDSLVWERRISIILSTLVFLSLALITVYNILWLIKRPVDADESVFLVIGRDLARGRLPYLDYWDHKMPGIYLVTWVLTSLHASLPVLRLIVAALWIPLAGLAWWLLGFGLPRAWLWLIPTVPAIVLHPDVEGGILLTEPFEGGAVLVALAASVRAGAERGKRALWLSALAGIALGIGVCFRPTAVLYAPVVVMALGLSEGRRRWHAPVPACAAFLVGLVVPIAAMLGWLQAHQLVQPWLAQAIGVNATITTSFAGMHGLRSTFVGLPQVAAGFGFVGLLATIGFLWPARPRRAGTLVFACAVAIGLIEAVMPLKGYPHYLLPAAFILLPFAIAALAETGNDPTDPRRRTVTVALLALLVCQVGGENLWRASQFRQAWTPTLHGIPIGVFQREAAPPDEVWAGGVAGAELYWYTGCSGATPYLYTAGGAAFAGLSEEQLLRDLQKRRPKLVLLGTNRRREQGVPVRDLTAVHAWLQRDYAQIASSERAVLWRRRDTGAVPTAGQLSGSPRVGS